MQGIHNAVGIETVSDDILSEVNDIQSLLEGSSSKAGFFNNVATSTKVGDDVKKKYASLQKELDDTMMPVKITISSLKAIMSAAWWK